MKERNSNLAPEKLRFAVLAADVAIFTLRDQTLYVRLGAVNRLPHYPAGWALPGGLLHPDETAEDAALRLVRDKGALNPDLLHMEQLYTFSTIGRDPRGRVVAVAYLALVPWESLTASEKLDTDQACWVPALRAKALAYDHDDILKMALERLRSRVTYTTLLSKVLPKEFTLTELEQSYECILKTRLDKRNFRKRVLKLHIVKPLGRKRRLGRARPAELYAFTSSKVKEIEVL